MPDFDIQVINVIGGLPGNPETAHAHAGNLVWCRDPDERVEAFRDRCTHAATAAGEPCLVFGGLLVGAAENGGV